MKKLLIWIVGFGLTTMAMSQTTNLELVSSSGDSFSNESYQINWSIGESMIETFSGGHYQLTQGFHQSNYIVTKVEELSESSINISVYPNPTSDFIFIDFTNSLVTESVLTIANINGKVLQIKTSMNNSEKLDFANYVSGVYFLNVKQNNKVVESFKIIKK